MLLRSTCLIAGYKNLKLVMGSLIVRLIKVIVGRAVTGPLHKTYFYAYYLENKNTCISLSLNRSNLEQQRCLL